MVVVGEVVVVVDILVDGVVVIVVVVAGWLGNYKSIVLTNC